MSHTMEIRVTDLDLHKVLKNRPFFFFFGSEPVRGVTLGQKRVVVELSQEAPGEPLVVETDKTLSPQEKSVLAERLCFCLGCEEDLSGFYATVADDPLLSPHLEEIVGNRLVSAFTDEEAVLCTICSQNVSFAQYKRMVKRIVDTYGVGLFFPSPREILERPELLDSCGLGYRKEYVIEACRFLERKWPQAGLEGLSRVRGFGPYSLALFRLFQERDYSVMYLDSLVKRIVHEDYGAGPFDKDREIVSFLRKRWGRWVGLGIVFLQKFLYDVRRP